MAPKDVKRTSGWIKEGQREPKDSPRELTCQGGGSRGETNEIDDFSKSLKHHMCLNQKRTSGVLFGALTGSGWLMLVNIGCNFSNVMLFYSFD